MKASRTLSSSWAQRGHWGMVCVLLLALLAQLGLNSFSHPGEHPRATIERLIGVDIAPMAMAPSLHDMSHMTEIGSRGAMDEGLCPPEHHHNTPHHHHDGDCPLCPLLGHILFTLTTLLVWQGIGVRRLYKWVRPLYARAPPRPTRERPPGRAPPVIL